MAADEQSQAIREHEVERISASFIEPEAVECGGKIKGTGRSSEIGVISRFWITLRRRRCIGFIKYCRLGAAQVCLLLFLAVSNRLRRGRERQLATAAEKSFLRRAAPMCQSPC
jgi:hypothetical protein